MAYQSLYRRYRPSRFGQLRGQGHVIGALQNAVRSDSVTHAYLFSGPRGTGKTSTARILAKALNCENLDNGEPCGECGSCKDMEAGRSFDLFELDAASNNGVDAIRDLIERAAVGSPGRTKVYILDEVHMLSPAASNALLKTLEEPPEHVRFVLATTDPQKVLPTIKSRTQHFEFQLLSAEELEEYVRWIGEDAGLDLDDEAIRYAVRQGRGSARDTLSALDQVVAAGGVTERTEPVEQLLEALAEKDPGIAIAAVADSLNLGHDPRVLGRALLDALRDIFLVSLDAPVPHLVPEDLQRMGSWSARLGTPLLTRSMEAVGQSLVDMRQAADPRVPLEVALVRLSIGGSSSSRAGGSSGSSESADAGLVAELVGRIERLEAQLRNGAPAGARGGGAAGARGGGAAAPSTSAGAPADRSDGSDVDLGSAGGPRNAPADSAPSGEDPGHSGESHPRPSGRPSGPERARAELAKRRGAASGRGNDADPSARRGETRPADQERPTSTARSGGVPPSPPTPPGAPTPPTPPAPRRAEAPAKTPASSPSIDGPDGPPQSERSVQDTSDDRRSIPPEHHEATASGTSGQVTTESLNAALADAVLPSMKGVAKALYSQGSFIAVDGLTITYSVENAPTRERAERFRPEVESLLSAYFSTPLELRIVADGSPPPASSSSPPSRSSTGRSAPNESGGSGGDRPSGTPNQTADQSSRDRSRRSDVDDQVSNGTGPRQGDRSRGPQTDQRHGSEDSGHHSDDDYMSIDVSDLEDADVAQTGLDRILEAFPGAKIIPSNQEAT